MRYPRTISCPPQMKPPASSASLMPKVQSHESAEVESPKEEHELSEDDEAVMNILKDNSPIDLIELKGRTGLSNKKWDKAIKGLTKNKLAKVEKTGESLFVELV